MEKIYTLIAEPWYQSYHRGPDDRKVHSLKTGSWYCMGWPERGNSLTEYRPGTAHSLNTDCWDEPEKGNSLTEYRPGTARTHWIQNARVNLRKVVNSLALPLTEYRIQNTAHSLNREYGDEPERGNSLTEYRPGTALTEYRILGWTWVREFAHWKQSWHCTHWIQNKGGGDLREGIHSMNTNLALQSLNRENWSEAERGNLHKEHRPGTALAEYRMLGWTWEK